MHLASLDLSKVFKGRPNNQKRPEGEYISDNLQWSNSRPSNRGATNFHCWVTKMKLQLKRLDKRSKVEKDTARLFRLINNFQSNSK